MTWNAPLVARRLFTCALVAALAAVAHAEAKAPPKGDPVKGKAVFSKNCVICHNADGSGGKRLTPNGHLSRDFRDPAFWASRTDDQIRATINAGVAKSGMIAWKGILKPQEIEDAMAYIKLFAKKDDSKAAAPAAGDAKAPAPSQK